MEATLCHKWYSIASFGIGTDCVFGCKNIEQPGMERHILAHYGICFNSIDF